MNFTFGQYTPLLSFTRRLITAHDSSATPGGIPIRTSANSLEHTASKTTFAPFLGVASKVYLRTVSLILSNHTECHRVPHIELGAQLRHRRTQAPYENSNQGDETRLGVKNNVRVRARDRVAHNTGANSTAAASCLML